MAKVNDFVIMIKNVVSKRQLKFLKVTTLKPLLHGSEF
jgi:hypothetical protein